MSIEIYISYRALMAECLLWVAAFGAVVAGIGIYVDYRDGISEMLEDRWYFIRENIWWFPYQLAIVGVPLWAIVDIYGSWILRREWAITRKNGTATGGAEVSVVKHSPVPNFVNLYVLADIVASCVHAYIASCTWRNICSRDDLMLTWFISMYFFAAPLGLMLLWRQIALLFGWRKATPGA